MSMEESFETVVVGGGQAGLAAGYFLAQKGQSFAILDENKRSGEAWRMRWDSLRLFTPSQFDGLPGKAFPGQKFYFPTKDEVADYLEAYAGQFKLPVQHGVKAERLSRNGSGYNLSTTVGTIHARHVIVATGAYQKPSTPAFARQLDPSILQLHSSAYCNPGQLPVQNILVVGAGNSGAEISMELARAGKRVWMAGRDVGRIPADSVGRLFGGGLFWWVNSRLFSVKNPVGRRLRANSLHRGTPLIRASRQAVAEAGVESVPRVAEVSSGKPVLEDGRSLPVEAVVWATGFRPDYRWIDLPLFDEYGYPRHQRGVVSEAPGLYFLGLHFQSALSSPLLGGVGEDAGYIVRQMK